MELIRCQGIEHFCFLRKYFQQNQQTLKRNLGEIDWTDLGKVFALVRGVAMLLLLQRGFSHPHFCNLSETCLNA